MTLKFTKMHGLGNDFVMINAVSCPFELTATTAMKISNRRTGVGCDQILIVEPPKEKGIDFNYRIINQDGSEVGQCGNGARCLARFVHEQGLTNKRELTVKTITTELKLTLNNLNSITVDMGVPEFEPEKIPFSANNKQPRYLLEVGGEMVQCSVLSLGNPHVVQFVEHIETAPVVSQGPLIQMHTRFPKHANVAYAEVVDRNNISARVFERGVGETLACGSGACAIMVAAKQENLVDNRVTIKLPGGNLNIDWSGEGHPVYMTGPAVNVFESELDLEKL